MVPLTIADQLLAPQNQKIKTKEILIAISSTDALETLSTVNADVTREYRRLKAELAKLEGIKSKISDASRRLDSSKMREGYVVDMLSMSTDLLRECKQYKPGSMELHKVQKALEW